MSTAEKIYQKTRALPEPSQTALLHIVELMSAPIPAREQKPRPRFGSARGLIMVGPEFEEPLEDFKPYTQ